MRETKAQKATRIANLLADYDAAKSDKSKAEARFDALKAQVAMIEDGTYGEWVRSHGTPRKITDNDAVALDFAERKVEIPTKLTKAPIIVRRTGS